MPLNFTDHMHVNHVEYFTDNTELANNLKALLLVTDPNQEQYRVLMRRKVVEQRDFWNHADRLGPNSIGTLHQYTNHANGFAWRQIFGQHAVANDNIYSLTNYAALKYLGTKLMHLNDTDESNTLLDAIIDADTSRALREAVVTPNAQSPDLLDINFANTQDWAVDSDDSVIEDDDLQNIKDYAVMTKVKFAIAKADTDKKEALIALANVANATELNAFFNSPEGNALGLGGLHNKISDGDVRWFKEWQELAAAKVLELELAAENDIDKLRAFSNAGSTAEFKNAVNALGAAPYNQDAFKNLFLDRNRHIQQQISQSVAAKVIEHYIAQSDDATHLAEVAGHANFRDKVNALHADLNIPVGNIPAGGGDAAIAFRRPLRVQAAKRFFEAGNFDWTQDNSAKLDLLHQLSELDLRDDPIQDGDKTAFKDALKNGGAQAGIFGMANSDEFNHADDGVVAKLFDSDQDYRNMAAQAKQKLQALQQQLIQHIDANPYTPNELVAISAAGGNPALYNAIHNPHHLVGIDQANIIDVEAFRRPIQAHAANKAVPSSIKGVSISNHDPNHRGKRQHLLTLAGTDTTTNHGKEQFREALRDLIPTAIENVEAMFADNDNLYADIALQALEKVTMLAIEQRGIADDHVYQIARWKDDGDGELNEDVRNIRGYEWQETLAKQIEKAHLSLDGTSLNKEQYKRALVRDGFRNKVQAHATQIHLQRLTNKNPTELNEKEWKILKKIAQCTSYEEFIGDQREDAGLPSSRPYTQDPFVGGDVPAKQGDFAAKKALALKNSLLYLAQHSDNAQDLMVLANAATNQPFFEKAVEILDLQDAEGEPADWADITAHIADAGNLRAEIQAAIIPNLIKNQVLKTEDLTKLRAVAGANGRPEFRALLRDEYGFSDEAVNPPKLIDDECNNLINEAAFLYLQGKVSALQTKRGSAADIRQKRLLAKWIVDNADDLHTIANDGVIAHVGHDYVRELLGLTPPADNAILNRLLFNEEPFRSEVVNNATKQATYAAVREQLALPANAGLAPLIALQQALLAGQPINDLLRFGVVHPNDLIGQALRNRYAVGGALNTKEAQEELLKQVNTTLFEFAMLSANEARAANADDPGYGAQVCTQPFTGNRQLVDAFAAMSLEEQNKMMAAVIDVNDPVNPQIADCYKPVFRQIVNSANPFHVKDHLEYLGFNTQHMAAKQEEGSKSLYEELAQDNKSLYHKIYNRKVADVLKQAGISVSDENTVLKINKIFFKTHPGGAALPNDNTSIPQSAEAKTQDELCANNPAGLNTYVNRLRDAFGYADGSPEHLALKTAFGLNPAGNAYIPANLPAVEGGDAIKNSIRGIHNANQHLLNRLNRYPDSPGVANHIVGVGNKEQQGKQFLRFLLSQDTTAANWNNIDGNLIEGLGRAFAKAKTHSDFKKMLEKQLPRANHYAGVHSKGPFHLPAGINGRVNAADVTIQHANLPDLLNPTHADFISEAQFDRLKKQQARLKLDDATHIVTDANHAGHGDDWRKEAVKLFDESIKGAGGDHFKDVHNSTVTLFSPGYKVLLEMLISHRNDDTVYYALPGYKNAQDAPERKSFLENQLDLIQKLRLEHQDLLDRYDEFLAGFDEGDTSPEVAALRTKREAVAHRLGVLNEAVPKFEKGIENCERVINNIVRAHAPSAAKFVTTHKVKNKEELNRLIASKRGAATPGEVPNQGPVGSLAVDARKKMDYGFEITDQEQQGEVAEFNILIDRDSGTGERYHSSALSEGVSKNERKNFGKSKVYCTGEPAYDGNNEQQVMNYAFNTVRTQLDRLDPDKKPGKKVAAGTVYFWVENHSKPEVAAMYYAAAIAHGVNPKHIKVRNCPDFSPQNAGIYKSTLGFVRLTDKYKNAFKNVPLREDTLKESDNIGVVQGQKAKGDSGKQLQKDHKEYKGQLDNLKKAGKYDKKDLERKISAINEGSDEDQNYTGKGLGR